MKKLIVIVISIILIGISLFFINKLLSPDDIEEERDETTVSFGDYELFNFDTNVNVYSLKDPSKFNIMVQNISFVYEENLLVIDKEQFSEIKNVYSYFAIYDNSVVVMAYQDINDNYYLAVYDTYTSKLNIIDKLDTFYISFDDIIFENVGIIISASKIRDNKIIGSEQNICKIKDTNMIIKQTYELYYNINTKEFDNKEVLYTNNLYSYINENNLCKE